MLTRVHYLVNKFFIQQRIGARVQDLPKTNAVVQYFPNKLFNQPRIGARVQYLSETNTRVLYLPKTNTYLCPWSSTFVSGVLSLSMDFYLSLWSSIFVYGVLSLSTEFYLCIWSSIFVYGGLLHASSSFFSKQIQSWQIQS